VPLREYICKTCGYEFDELVGVNKDDSEITCRICGGVVERKMSSFSAVVAGGTSNEPIDMRIGRDAENRWKALSERQAGRRGDKVPEPVSAPRDKDGKYIPMEVVGTKDEREKRKEYSGALQEHRQERMKRGQGQFTDTGAF